MSDRGIEESSEPVGSKGTCPCDDPSESFQMYSDDHGHCFAGGCPHPYWSAAKLAEMGWEIDPDNIKQGGHSSETRKRMSEDLQHLIDSAEVRALTSRKITQATAQKWDYRGRINSKGEAEHVAIYRDETGAIVGAKVRNPDKEFFIVGELPPLYGMQFLGNGGKKIILVEGEIDALSVSQVIKMFPVVSIPKGAPNAKKDVAKVLDRLAAFDEVVICFDQDDVGRKAAEDVAKMLPPGKASLAVLPRKDPNEMLQHGEIDALVNCIFHPKPYSPDGIVLARDVMASALVKPGWGLRMGIAFLDDLQWGWRDQEIIVGGAGIGMGKSDLMYQVAAHMSHAANPDRVPIAVFNYEASTEETFTGLAGKNAQRRFDVPDPEDGSPNIFYTEAERLAAFRYLSEECAQVYINDDNGAVTWEAVKERLRYLVHAHGIKRAFIDPMAALAASLKDERTGIDILMAEAKALCKELGIGIWFNSHLARPSEGKSHEEGGRVTQKNFRGSGAITMWASLVFGLERNQQADDPAERSATTMRALKVRKNGKMAGTTSQYTWNEMNGMVEECAPRMPEPEACKDAPPFTGAPLA